MSAFTPSTCAECGVECAVGMQHVALIRGVWTLWRECPACFFGLEERSRIDRERGEATAKKKLAGERAA